MPRTFYALLFSIPLVVLSAAATLTARADDKTGPAWIELPEQTGSLLSGRLVKLCHLPVKA